MTRGTSSKSRKNKKARLVIATDSFLPRWDGVARFLSQIIPKLTDTFRITIIAPRFSGKKPRIKEVKIIRIPTYNFSLGDYTPSRPCFRKVGKIIKESDIVWAHSIGPIGAAAMYKARAEKKRLCSFIHSIEWRLFPNSIPRSKILNRFTKSVTLAFARNLYNKADMLMVPSKEVARLFEEKKIYAKKTLVHLGVDTNKFRPAKNKRSSKKSVNIDPDSFVIGFCGRIAREKDLPTLYCAFAKINKKHRNCTLLVVGKGINAENDCIKENKNVIFTGSKDNVVPYLQAMDVYVLPSLTETTSLSTIEAMSCGIPVITTPTGSLKEYVHPGVNGFLFSKKDSKELAKYIEKLINDNKMRKKLAKNARETALKKFRFKRTAKEIKNILVKIKSQI